MSDLDDQVGAEIDRANQRVVETERRVADLLARGGPVLGRATSADGTITVVTPPGAPPSEVQVEPGALRMGPDALAAEIVRVAARAARDAGARLHRSLGRVVDPGTANGLAELGFEPRADEPGPERWSR
ncbi:hypothetical protein [Umezawaea endophytica]|uniref:YbaB/EbfC DNA-binding family protein n=1 Tax=Umezawaea endophytica TaxID=1654476 RepID=A0A9X2VYD1_9PSEU|nr:hypothetical protein [Umezawaea endophytica]MCS7484284.1 hypothetical protein [Umezawaea endophytica]